MKKQKIWKKYKAGTSMSIVCFLIALFGFFFGAMNIAIAYIGLSVADKEGKDSTFHKMAHAAIRAATVVTIARILFYAKVILLQGGSLLGSEMTSFLLHLFFG